ncbi:MAG: hypothetical protein CMP50_02360 [Flavobacteriales bacterium]|jgi:hypothetical protein|nr:hypothetical protein [Flavobacteriales bacterium]|tara:strand:- start:2856 stop:3137 length:282 start_codon:yes stop_codon:yes gene_type:complete
MVKNWILIISIFFVGCLTNKSTELVIPRDQFKEILIDIHKMELNHLDSVSILESVLANHNISYDLYKNTILFYSEEPSTMLDILYEVEDSVLD